MDRTLMKYCQGTMCHSYKTKDRLRGTKGNKFYQTRRRSKFYYLGGNACSMACERDWFDKYGEQAINHFGRIVEPIKLTEDNAWYKWSSYNGYDNTPRYNRFFVNDLLGQRISITEQEFDNKEITKPNNLSQ